MVQDNNIDNLCKGTEERALPRAVKVAWLNLEERQCDELEYWPFYVNSFKTDGVNKGFIVEVVGYSLSFGFSFLSPCTISMGWCMCSFLPVYK